MRTIYCLVFLFSTIIANALNKEAENKSLKISFNKIDEKISLDDEGFFSIEDVKKSENEKKENKKPEDKKTKTLNNKEDHSLCMVRNCCEPYERCCYPMPLPAKCGMFFLEGEYLYFKTYSLTPFIGIRKQVPPPTINSSTEYDSNDLFIPIDANSGYKATLGIYFSKCSYATARYTQFESDGEKSISVDDVDLNSSPNRSGLTFFWLVGTRAGPSDLNNVERVNASARNRFRMKVIDIDFYRVVGCSKLAITPFVGGRIAWVKTDLFVDYKFIDPSLDFDQGHHVDVDQHFNLGAGFHTGINMDLDLFKNLSLYTTTSFSALIGKRNFRLRDLLLIDDSGPTSSRITENYKETDVQFAGSFGFGLYEAHNHSFLRFGSAERAGAVGPCVGRSRRA